MTPEQIKAKLDSLDKVPANRPVAINASELRALCEAALGITAEPATTDED